MDDGTIPRLWQLRADADQRLRELDACLITELSHQWTELAERVRQLEAVGVGAGVPQAVAMAAAAPITVNAPTQPRYDAPPPRPVQPPPPSGSPVIVQQASGPRDPGLDVVASPRGPGPAGPPASAVPPPVPLWRQPGFAAKALAITGGAVTLIGVAFLLVLAAQYGLFGPLARALSAAALSGVLVWLAFVVRGRDVRNPGAPILAATGVAAGYLSVVTATVIYEWLPPVLGASLVIGIGLGGALIARLWTNEWVGIIAVGGGLVMAVYVGGEAPLATAALMLAFTAASLGFAVGADWRILPFARMLPMVMYALWLVAILPELWEPPAASPLAMAVVVSTLSCVGLAGAWVARGSQASRRIAAGLAVVAALPSVALSAGLASVHERAWAAGLLAAVAALYVAASLIRRAPEDVRAVAVPVGAGLTVLAGYQATDARFLAVLLLTMASIYLGVALRLRSRWWTWVGGTLAFVGVLAWLPSITAFVVQPSPALADPEHLGASIGVVVVSVLGALIARQRGVADSTILYAGASGALLGASVGLILAATWIGSSVGDPVGGYQAGQVIVTVAWMAACIVFLRRALADRRRADTWLRLALALAMLAVVKLFLIDLGTLGAPIRVVSFLGVGLLLLFIGTRYAKAWDRARDGLQPDPLDSGADADGAPSRSPDAPS